MSERAAAAATPVTKGGLAAWGAVLWTQVRILLFLAREKDFASFGPRHLIFGLACTWLAGAGRHWDQPALPLAQALGLVSLLMPFALATLFHLVVWPLKPARWSYGHVLTFVSLTAMPAFLYAPPLGRWFDMSDVNLWLLGIVATWRVGLMAVYLHRWAGFKRALVVAALLLPLASIVIVLRLLNLDRAVFEIMARHHREPTPDDAAFGLLTMLTVLSFLALPFVLGAYLIAIAGRRGGKGHVDPPRFVVREEGPADAAGIRNVNELAFGRRAEADLIDALRERCAVIASFVADDSWAAGISGHLLLSPIELVTAGGAPRIIAAIGPMAVLPAHQRNGIGSLLVRHAIDYCRDAGYDGIVVVGHPAYYARFGFVPASRFGIRSEYSVPDDVFMALEIRDGSLHGVAGSVVKYAPPFGEPT